MYWCVANEGFPISSRVCRTMASHQRFILLTLSFFPGYFWKSAIADSHMHIVFMNLTLFDTFFKLCVFFGGWVASKSRVNQPLGWLKLGSSPLRDPKIHYTRYKMWCMLVKSHRFFTGKSVCIEIKFDYNKISAPSSSWSSFVFEPSAVFKDVRCRMMQWRSLKM